MSRPSEHPVSTRRARPRWIVVAALGASQTLAWGSSYYLPAILAEPIAAGIGVPRAWPFAAFSCALLIVAALGPHVGRAIDRHGGRGVLTLSTVVLVAGLVTLAAATGPLTLFLAWAVLGVGMALGLYDSAFAALTTLYAGDASRPITGVTLIAGFASTVSWPLSSLLSDAIGWRQTCLVWAALDLFVALPINRFVLPSSPRLPRAPRADSEGPVRWKPRREMILLAYVFAATWFVTGSMAAHLPTLLQRWGATRVQAVAAAALVGPAQVGARLVEFFVLRRVHPVVSARIASALHPIGAALLIVAGAPGAPLFAMFYGAGNGLLTIARGTVPLAVFGPDRYGERTGLLGAPARAVQALAPLLFGLLLDVMGRRVVLVSAGSCVSALAALLWIRGGSAEGKSRAPPSE